MPEPPGTSSYVQYAAVQWSPSYVTWLPPVYAVWLFHAATPAQLPLLVGLDAALLLVEVGLTLVDTVVDTLVEDGAAEAPETGHESARTASIHEAAASGNSQTMTPASQP